jgi:hypothetical protein
MDRVLAPIIGPSDAVPTEENVLLATRAAMLCAPRTTKSCTHIVPAELVFEKPTTPDTIHGELMFDCAEVFMLK